MPRWIGFSGGHPLNRLRLHAVLGCAALLIVTSAAFAQQQPAFDGKAWWEHVKFLADDNMEGRDTGSPGLKRASAYVVDQLKQAGFQPAGTNGFYQAIKFRTRELDEANSSMTLVQGEKQQKITLGDDAVFSTRVDLAPEVNAPLVFVGYGLRIPELRLDEYAGLDVKGKVIVMFSGSPSKVPGPLSAHYNSAGEKARLMRELGVVGFITLPNPAAMDLPWSRIASSRLHPAMAIDDEKLNDSRGIQFAASWNPAKAEVLFEGTGHTFAEIAALGKDRKPLPHFELGKSIHAKTHVNSHEVESSNVIGKLPGTDPKLKDQYVVLSAHMDHVGVGEPINGDKIYNGAMDNASGTAALIEVAKSLKGVRPKRSLLFVFVTAEEKGLLGSRYFAAYPTVPIRSIVADINTDMFLPIYPMKSLIVYGLNESTLGDEITRVAKRDDVATMDDPEPLQNHFIRSDQYNFIKGGVPSVALKNGYEKGSPEEAKVKEWSHTRYHAPSDDLQQPVDLSAAAEFERIVRGTMIEVANAPARPEWKSDSFFKRYANEQGAGQ
jgi:hypothetical protein